MHHPAAINERTPEPEQNEYGVGHFDPGSQGSIKNEKSGGPTLTQPTTTSWRRNNLSGEESNQLGIA